MIVANFMQITLPEMADTITFFCRHLNKAQHNYRHALENGRTGDAQNIFKKIVHFQRALQALEHIEPVGDERDEE